MKKLTYSIEQTIDGMFLGNKTRFINDYPPGQRPNLLGQVLLCNSVMRIAFFATRDLKVGEELFFFYGEK